MKDLSTLVSFILIICFQAHSQTDYSSRPWTADEAKNPKIVVNTNGKMLVFPQYIRGEDLICSKKCFECEKSHVENTSGLKVRNDSSSALGFTAFTIPPAMHPSAITAALSGK